MIGTEYHGSMDRYFDAELSAGACIVLCIVRVSMVGSEYHSRADSHLSAEPSAGAYIVVSQGEDQLDAIGLCLADYIVQSFTA